MGVSYLHRFQRCILPLTDSKSVKEVHASDQPYQFIALPFDLHGSHEGNKIDCLTKGLKDPPIPRRLVRQSQIPPDLSPAYTNSSSNLSGVRLVSKHGEVRTGNQASL